MNSVPRRFQGTPAAAGVAIAPAFLFLPQQAPSVPTTQADATPEEAMARLHQALDAAREEIHHLLAHARQQVGDEQAAIFEAHLLFLDDPTLLGQVEQAVQQGQPLLTAWQQAIEAQAAMLEALDDPVFSARAVDLHDVGQRVARHLSGQSNDLPLPDEPAIIVARELTPSQTILLPKDLVRGFCTVQGSRTSHVAILARGLGLPAVVGLPEAFLQAVHTGDTLILDGHTGEVILRPDEATIAAYRRKAASEAAAEDTLRAAAVQSAITPDGRRVSVGANLGGGGEEETRRAVALGAEGVGLLRTEFLYMERHTPPDEEEQIAAYSAYIRAMEGRPVIFRTVDIGGDKALPYLDLPAEANPFLGQRGIRLALAQPDLFRTQLRAILRAGAGTEGVVKIMFPMVATLEEVQAAKAHLQAVQERLAAEGIAHAQGVEVGIMVEVPAAALLADVLAAEVDFFSIGTNDLSQYTLAADRTHPQVGALADAFHPAVLRLIQQVVVGAHAAGIWVGVCGELAGEPLAAPLLLGLGVDELSMAALSIPAVKARLRAWRYADAQALAEQVLRLPSAEAVRAALRAATPPSG